MLTLGQRSTMTYDQVGNTQTVTDFNGETITFTYDEQNRLKQKSFEDGSKVIYTYTRNNLQDTIAFVDATGQPTALYDYDYDGRDRLTQRTDTLGLGNDQTVRSIEYGYDVASNRTSVTTASGTTTYTYDERNRLDVVRLNGLLQADYDYNAVSNLTQTTFGNSTQETRQYDDLNRLKKLEDWQGTTKLASYEYTLDKVGNRTQIDEFQNGESRTLKYTYDNLYRLTKEVIDAAGTQNDLTQEYSYDEVGNRQWKKEIANGSTVQTNYTYDNNDRLLNEKVNGVVTVGYTYDDNGSTLTKTEAAGTTTYTWDDEKRLISAEVNGQQMQYRYNDQGIRVSSIVNGVETRYLLDEGMVAQVWEEYSPDGQAQVSYVYGNDLVNQTQAGQTTFYLVDGLGSTRLLTDAQGAILNDYRYDAFGKTLGETGTVDNKYLFAGEQFDEGLGDYHLRQRYYDTDAGRFTRRDTYEGHTIEPSSLHKYLYANANPIKYVDPTGYTSSLAEAVAVSVLTGILADLIMPSPVGAGSGFDELPGEPGLEKLILEAVLGLVLSRNVPRLFTALTGRGSSQFIYNNLIPDRLAQELADATRLGVKPFTIGSKEFAKVVNEGEVIKWAVNEGGELVMVPKMVNGAEIAHTVITGGKSIVAAGEAQVAGYSGNYYLLEITNHSGHYRPSAITEQIGRLAFQKAGVKAGR